MKHRLHQLRAFLYTRNCFYLILGFFVLQALWMVFSALYPMAFDEDFHFGIIKIYAEQWSPFLQQQPQNAGAFGALVSDPSYLFHYLMSFPYRLIALFTDNQTTQIIILRIMNVAFFAYALVLFRRVLLRATRSPLIANGAIAIFTLIPIVPQLAAHINYDNVLMPLMAALCLLVYRMIDEFNAGKLRAVSLLQFVALGMLTSLVKYAYLPILGAAVFFLLWYGWKRLSVAQARQSLIADWSALHRWQMIGLIALVVVSSVLFLQRYGVNTIKYHTPIADCGQVLPFEECSQYGPWIRNYNYAEQKGDVDTNPLAYTYRWLHDLEYRLFFAVSGPTINYANYPPLPVPYVTATLVAIVGFFAVCRYGRRMARSDPFMIFSMVTIVLYCGALWVEDYSQFVETGQPVAINGRYLLPILFLAAILIGRAAQYALARQAKLRMVLACLVVVGFLYGGGVVTFIMRSEDTWYWPNATVVDMNHAARKVLDPGIFQGSKYY